MVVKLGVEQAVIQLFVVGEQQQPLAVGIEPTDALVGSQVVLSFGIPFALIPLVMLSSRRKTMGEMVNPRWLTVLASTLAAMIIALNVFLLEQLFFG